MRSGSPLKYSVNKPSKFSNQDHNGNLSVLQPRFSSNDRINIWNQIYKKHILYLPYLLNPHAFFPEQSSDFYDTICNKR